MRKLLLVVSVLALAPLADASPGAGVAQVVAEATRGQSFTGITLYPATRFEFTNCNVDGTTTAAQTITAGTYLFRVTTEDTWICYAATCVSPNGEKFPAGAMMLLTFRSSQSVSCRSASSTGDAIFTKGG